MSDVNSIITQLNKVSSKIPIYIPTLKKDVLFSPITLAHQKSIIDKTVSSRFGLIDLFNSIYNIIKLSTTNSVEEFNTIDRINIILTLRKNISQVYGDVDLEKLLAKNRNIVLPPTSKTVTTDKFILDLQTPNLTTDYKYNNYIITTYKDENEIIGKLLVNEICKFVKKITIVETNEILELDSLPIKSKFTVIETLNLSLFKDVMNYINEIRDAEASLVKLDDKQVDIGPEIFML